MKTLAVWVGIIFLAMVGTFGAYVGYTENDVGATAFGIVVVIIAVVAGIIVASDKNKEF